MTDRKKKLLLIQIFLLLLCLIFIFYTYNLKNEKNNKIIISKDIEQKIEKSMGNQEGDIFFNIEYSGIDLEGNRYILKSKEARNDNKNQNIIFMKEVSGIFYFKDGTNLKINSSEGIYNNQTLDIIFIRKVIAFYKDGKLLAERAEYNNSENNIKVTNNVHVIDITGEIFADELFFDMNENKLDIASYKNKKINANINLK
jgi:lipopolysaccharide assembly outer membrane protein LptD (OstA)